MNGTKSRRLDRLLTRPPKENGTESLHSICVFIYGIGGLCPRCWFRISGSGPTLAQQTREMNINPSKQGCQGTYGRSSLDWCQQGGQVGAWNRAERSNGRPKATKRRRLTMLICGRSKFSIVNQAIKVLCKFPSKIMTYSTLSVTSPRISAALRFLITGMFRKDKTILYIFGRRVFLICQQCWEGLISYDLNGEEYMPTCVCFRT